MLYIPWHVSQTNLSLYNPCHSCGICTLCSTCHESAANWSVTVANPTSDKQKLHKADISTPCLVTFKDSKVQTRRQHAKGTRTEYPGHWGLHFWSGAWHHPNTWPMKTSNWSHVPQYAFGCVCASLHCLFEAGRQMCRTGLLALVVCFLLSTWQKESGMSADPPREPSELAKWLRREKNLRSDICKVLQGKQFLHLVNQRNDACEFRMDELKNTSYNVLRLTIKTVDQIWGDFICCGKFCIHRAWNQLADGFWRELNFPRRCSWMQKLSSVSRVLNTP